jgi:pyruvate/2-oxoglutarate dehydrogenase complex dihydrolipoamide dehydrogenase (E3) component
MELIEETDDPTRERYWVENTECINRIIPGRTRKEHYENNRDIILNKKKEHYENNKEKIKQYYENNKDKTKEYKKYINSMGGDPRYNNNLLKIYVNLFNLN